MTQHSNPTPRRLRRGLVSAISVVSVAALTLSACGAAKSSNGVNGAKQNTNVTFTGDPITVMTFAPSNTSTLNMPAAITIAQHAAITINNAGGINGHELKVLTCNEGADSNKALACARQAVDAKVTAVIGGFTAYGDAVMPILAKAGIPWLAPPGVSSAEASSKDSYMVSSGVYGLGELGALAAEDKCQKIASVVFDIPTSAAIGGLINAGVTKHGGKPVTEIKVPPTTTDFGSLAAQVGNYDCAIMGIGSQQVAALSLAEASLGKHTTYYVVQGGLTDAAIKIAGKSLDGAKSLSAFAMPTDPAFKPAIDAVGDLNGEESGGWSLAWYTNTWVGYQVLAEVLAKSTDFSAAGLTAALNTTQSVDTKGLTQPFGFTQEFPIPGMNRVFNHKVLVTEVKDGKIVAASPTWVDLLSAFM